MDVFDEGLYRSGRKKKKSTMLSNSDSKTVTPKWPEVNRLKKQTQEWLSEQEKEGPTDVRCGRSQTDQVSGAETECQEKQPP